MSDKYIFSIIIPIYNMEDYLDECLSSVAIQKFESIEVILIDDGSTDSSVEICEKYCKAYKYFKLVRQHNSGQGMARNHGLRLAVGEFVLFVDSDDKIDSDLCADMHEVMKSGTYDFVNFGLNFVDVHGNVKHSMSEFNISVLSGTAIFQASMLDNQVFSSPVNKVYRRSFLLDNNIFFPPVKTSEDIYFSRVLSFYANSTFFVSKVYYHALIRDDSTSRKFSIKNLKDTFAVINLVSGFLSDKNALEKYRDLYEANLVKQLSYLMVLAAFRVNSQKEYLECVRFYSKHVSSSNACKVKMLSYLKPKNKFIFFLCQYPRVLRIAAIAIKLIRFKPY